MSAFGLAFLFPEDKPSTIYCIFAKLEKQIRKRKFCLRLEITLKISQNKTEFNEVQWTIIESIRLRERDSKMENSLQTTNHNNQLQLWAGRVRDRRSSELSVKQWCAENNIAVGTYYHWQKKVYEAYACQEDVHFEEICITPSTSSSSIAAAICIGKARVEIYNGAEPDTIQAVVAAVKIC